MKYFVVQPCYICPSYGPYLYLDNLVAMLFNIHSISAGRAVPGTDHFGPTTVPVWPRKSMSLDFCMYVSVGLALEEGASLRLLD